MQSVQRKFGRLLGRNPGDNAKVSVLLNDYEDADRILAKASTFSSSLAPPPNPQSTTTKVNTQSSSSSKAQNPGKSHGLL